MLKADSYGRLMIGYDLEYFILTSKKAVRGQWSNYIEFVRASVIFSRLLCCC